MKKSFILAPIASWLTAVMLLCFNTAPAQAPDCSDPASPACYDPISATLDSLINQSYIQRLNFSELGTQQPGSFQPYEVPTYADDIYRKRIEKIQTPIPLTFNDEVKQYINMYAVQKRGLTERVMGLANLYFPLYEQILDQQGLPIEFKYLSIVESALNPTAVSPVGATGLWQFMLATGKMYGLKVNSYIDERRDPVKSTYAACQYFKDMYAIYNDWLLVIASYNCGAGNVNRAIARSGGKKTFWEISPYLPRETRGYVPAFIAVTYLMNYSSEHNLAAVPPLINYFEVDTVMIHHRVELRQVADAINMPVEMLSYLNPVYKRGLVPEADGAQVLRLPTSRMNAYLANEAAIVQPGLQAAAQFAASQEYQNDPVTYVNQMVSRTYKVRRGDHLQSIANKFNCSVTDLKKWNKLRTTRLMAGQSLKVYVNVPKRVETKTASAPVKQSTPDTAGAVHPTDSSNHDAVTASATPSVPDERLSTIYHVVAPGDTLWKIAQRYEGLTVEKIKEINSLQSNELKIGTKLKVTVGG